MWIKCSEFMPPDKLDVLVYGKVNEHLVPLHGAYWHHVMCRVNNEWVEEGFDGDVWNGLEPIAWTLLPELPK